MEMATLGRTGLKVSRLGVGLVEIGFQLSEGEVDLAGRLLNIALNGGINFFDTAECYGISEDLIGDTISHRRDDFILATKAGHPSFGTDGPRFTGDTVRKSIERSLKRLKTDHVDLLQVHAYDIFGQPPDEVIEAVLGDGASAAEVSRIGSPQIWRFSHRLFPKSYRRMRAKYLTI